MKTLRIIRQLSAAVRGSAIAGSAALQIAGKRQVSNFIGEWVPTLLIFGLYNKIVKILGSDPRPQNCVNTHYSTLPGTELVTW